ncbi:MAG TPA: 3-dehydroquinate synthase [Candidatus Didemnitutus sp.]|nr:3-dehydroquinate synthase [Candidatus Didemnitutus sp.]
MSSPLHVTLASHSYPLQFCEDLKSAIAPLLKSHAEKGRRAIMLTDQTVAAKHAALIDGAFVGMPRFVLPPGEKTKSLEHLGRVLDFLAEQRIDRTGVLWVLGGGVIGDLGGFAAASYLRGIDFVQIPTTLLAMVDSSIGGKTGINLAAGKNLAGAFHHPQTVFIAKEFLATLPPREFAAGMAEVIKYGLLGDATLFARLERAPLTIESDDLLAVIRRCCELKAAVVQADERETAKEGGRALLNLGHTFGHAVEQTTGYGRYLHGEAVAIGLAAAARLSLKLGHISAADVARVEKTVSAHALPIRLREPLSLEALMTAMQRDKKVRAGKLRFVVLKRLGEAATQGDVDAALVEQVWRELGAA